MSFDIGTVTIYDDSVSIMDPEVLVMAKAIPLAFNQAKFWNMLTAPAMEISDMKYEIKSRNLTEQTGTIGTGSGTGWADTSTTAALPMNSSAVNVLTIGCVLQVEDEVVVVKAIDRTANTIDVYERGAGSTDGATHADDTAFTVIGQASNDTDLKNVESLSENTNEYINYCQTVFETIDYTKKQAIIGRKGLADPIEILKQEAMNRFAAKAARSALLGVKREGTGAIPYMTAGLYNQIKDTASATRPILRYDVSSAAFTETVLKAALEDVFERGNPDTILLSQENKNIMNSFNQAFLNTGIENKRAGYSVNQYEYEGAVLDIVVDADCTNDRVEVITKDKCQKSWLRNDTLRYVEEPKNSSRENRDSLQGSYSVAVEGVGYDHIDIYGISN